MMKLIRPAQAILFLLINLGISQAFAYCSADITFGNQKEAIDPALYPALRGIPYPSEGGSAVNRYYVDQYAKDIIQETSTSFLSRSHPSVKQDGSFDFDLPVWVRLKTTTINKVPNNPSGQSKDIAFLLVQTLMGEENKSGVQYLYEVPNDANRGSDEVEHVGDSGGVYYRFRDPVDNPTLWSEWERFDNREVESIQISMHEGMSLRIGIVESGDASKDIDLDISNSVQVNDLIFQPNATIESSKNLTFKAFSNEINLSQKKLLDVTEVNFPKMTLAEGEIKSNQTEMDIQDAIGVVLFGDSDLADISKAQLALVDISVDKIETVGQSLFLDANNDQIVFQGSLLDEITLLSTKSLVLTGTTNQINALEGMKFFEGSGKLDFDNNNADFEGLIAFGERDEMIFDGTNNVTLNKDLLISSRNNMTKLGNNAYLRTNGGVIALAGLKIENDAIGADAEIEIEVPQLVFGAQLDRNIVKDVLDIQITDNTSPDVLTIDSEGIKSAGNLTITTDVEMSRLGAATGGHDLKTLASLQVGELTFEQRALKGSGNPLLIKGAPKISIVNSAGQAAVITNVGKAVDPKDALIKSELILEARDLRLDEVLGPDAELDLGGYTFSNISSSGLEEGQALTKGMIDTRANSFFPQYAFCRGTASQHRSAGAAVGTKIRWIRDHCDNTSALSINSDVSVTISMTGGASSARYLLTEDTIYAISGRGGFVSWEEEQATYQALRSLSTAGEKGKSPTNYEYYSFGSISGGPQYDAMFSAFSNSWMQTFNFSGSGSVINGGHIAFQRWTAGSSGGERIRMRIQHSHLNRSLLCIDCVF